MKTISIHNLDENILSRLEIIATDQGISLNKVIKDQLAKVLGYKVAAKRTPENDFSEFLGFWTDGELREFNEATKDLRTIDPEDWK